MEKHFSWCDHDTFILTTMKLHLFSPMSLLIAPINRKWIKILVATPVNEKITYCIILFFKKTCILYDFFLLLWVIFYKGVICDSLNDFYNIFQNSLTQHLNFQVRFFLTERKSKLVIWDGYLRQWSKSGFDELYV